MNSILFVCLGNICRSAMAEGVFRAEAGRRGLADIVIDSAGTSDWHIGSPPDPRAIAAAADRNIDISAQQARQIADGDFDSFDLILAMDAANLSKLRGLAGEDRQRKVRLLLDFAGDLAIREVADPYYGDEDGFERTLDLLEIAGRGLADQIVRSNS